MAGVYDDKVSVRLYLIQSYSLHYCIKLASVQVVLQAINDNIRKKTDEAEMNHTIPDRCLHSHIVHSLET